MASKIVVNLDTSKEVFLNSKCKQNDDLILECNIFENGLAKDLTNCSIVIQALKADKTYIIQNTDITKNKNNFIANLVRDFTRVSGETEIEIVLTESSKQNTTFSFCLEVVGSVIRGAVESKNTVTILENLQDKIEEAGVVKQETEQLIEKGGAATKGDIQEVNAHLENIESKEIPRIYNYNNKFITNYKGLCVRAWETNSLYSNRFREDFINLTNKIGINSVALTINTYQQDITSNNPFNRVPIKITEIEDYIKFLKQNNLRILFKHHVEIDTSEYKWRASINPSDVELWFENYKNGVIEYAKLCEKYKVEAFSIGSEYRYLTENYGKKWVELIKEIRKVYTGLLTYGANLNNDKRDEVHRISFWDYLDFIGLDFYIYPIENGSVDDYKKAFYHTKNHKNVHLMMDSIANKYNKPIVFCEYGKGDKTEDKNNYIKAIHETLSTKEYIKGGFIWVYDPIITDWVETNETTINLLKSNNITKSILKNDGYYTSIKNDSETRFSKFLGYTINTTYKDVYIDFDFYIKGATNDTNQNYSKVRIKITTHDTTTPKIFYEVDGNISESYFVYTITDNLIEFYVKVPQYCSVIYKPFSSEIGQFNIYDYQELKSVSGTTATNKINEQSSIALTIANIGNLKMATGVISGSMTSGVINQTITIPNITQVFGISVNVNYINGGNSYDVVCHGKYIGNNNIEFSGKHLTVQGGYSYELSYIVYYK